MERTAVQKAANAAYQQQQRRLDSADIRRRAADQSIRRPVRMFPDPQPGDYTLADLMDAQLVDDSGYSPDTADWLASYRKPLAEIPWRPSLVRRGERPRVRQPIRLMVPDGDYRKAIAALKATLKGRKGKSRILLKSKLARLETALRLSELRHTWPTMPEPKALPEPVPHVVAIVQADYWPCPDRPTSAEYRAAMTSLSSSRWS